VNTTLQQDAVQGEKHVAVVGRGSGERGENPGQRGGGEELTK
jgi:hypothetical protein